MTQIWAHRGARLTQPENTAAAYAAAVEAGADGIELDVHLAADGTVVCAHDAVLVGADGARVVLSDATAAEIARVDVGDPVHGVHRVPLLGDVLDLLSDSSITLNIELKHGDAPTAGLERAVVDLVRGSQMAERVVYSSFNHLSLLSIREIDPTADIAPVYVEALVDPWDYAARLGATAVHPFAPTLTLPGVLGGFARSGIAVRPWTVNAAADWVALCEAHVDAIITDDPAGAVAARNRLGSAISVTEAEDTPRHAAFSYSSSLAATSPGVVGSSAVVQPEVTAAAV